MWQLSSKFAVFGFLIFLTSCQTIESECVSEIQITDDIISPDFTGLDDAPLDNLERSLWVRNFWQSNCPSFSELDIASSAFKNFSCIVPGEVTQKVVVGSHYDKVKEGSGIADNWSGVMLNSNLLKHFGQNKPFYTLEFVAFGREEIGMKGARAYLKSADVNGIEAMINLDTFGLGPLVIDRRSTPGLVCLASQTAEAMGVDYSYSNLRDITGDWAPFKQHGVAVLNINSITPKTIRRIHNRRDKVGNVDLSRLHEAYRLYVNLINNLSAD